MHSYLISLMFVNFHCQFLFQPPESQTMPVPDPVYIDIGPSTTSQENSQMILVPPCDDKVEYAEVKQTVSADSKPAAGEPVQVLGMPDDTWRS